jgi:hypothetical protein
VNILTCLYIYVIEAHLPLIEDKNLVAEITLKKYDGIGSKVYSLW